MVVKGALEFAGWRTQKKSHVFRDGMAYAILWGRRALGPYEQTCLERDLLPHADKLHVVI